MLLLSSDNHTIIHIALFYSILTCACLSFLILGLLFTEFYLLFGTVYISPVFVLISILEISKWTYTQNKYYKDLSTYPSNDNASFSLKHVIRTANVSEILKSAVTLIGCVIGFFIIAVFFGAQVFREPEKTFMFSSLITILTAFPLCLHLGSSSVVHSISGRKPCNVLHNLLYRNLQWTLFGAWLGAFVIPLDWDRPWQVWPIPCCTGALVGYTVSHYALLIDFFLSNDQNIPINRKKH